METKLGGTRNLPSLCTGAVFIFAVLRKEGCHVPHTHCRTYQKIIWQKHNIKRYQSYRRKGDVISILGPSGTGKTTLLRCFNYLEKPEAGRLSIDDVSVDFSHISKTEVQKLRRKSTMVFQQFNLFRNKNVLENITEGLIYGYGKTKKEAEEIAMEELSRVRMTDYAHMYPSELSGGMQQRVGIARALAPKPDVILFDEPTSALDPELVGEVLDTIASVATLGITMIIVTHEMHFAQDISTKAVFMSDGLIVEEGHPKEFFSHPKEEQTRTFLRRMLKREEA